MNAVLHQQIANRLTDEETCGCIIEIGSCGNQSR